MADIEWTIPDRIEWEYDRTSLKASNPNNARLQAMPDKEMEFEEERALALLLVNDVIFLNDHWWEDDWPEGAKKVTSLNVSCNDVFAWGCSDAEEMPHDELKNLYRMWRKDPEWGAAVWCMLQRKQMPQKPVEDIIRRAGIWNFEELGLAPNTMDAEISAIFGGDNKAVLTVDSAKPAA